jgi:VCBS repeat-containing protein
MQVQQVNDDRTVSLLVTAKGLWVYQFSNQQKQQLAKLVAGKSINSAKAILQAQPGVHSVTISSNNATLPTDPSQIAISIQTLSGLQSAGTPTPFPAPPASTPKTPQPGRGDIVGGNIG